MQSSNWDIDMLEKEMRYGERLRVVNEQLETIVKLTMRMKKRPIAIIEHLWSRGSLDNNLSVDEYLVRFNEAAKQKWSDKIKRTNDTDATDIEKWVATYFKIPLVKVANTQQKPAPKVQGVAIENLITQSKPIIERGGYMNEAQKTQFMDIVKGLSQEMRDANKEMCKQLFTLPVKA